MNITNVLEKHRKWLLNEDGGECANLRGADLSGANLPSRFVSVVRVGSRNGMTTYDIDGDRIWCGCFAGSIAEFENRVHETYPDGQLGI